MRTLVRTRLRPMTAADIPQVMEIERESFPSIWPQTAYRRELTNKVARYWVLAEVLDAATPPHRPSGLLGAFRRIGAGPPASERVLGFIGLWLMVGDAHIVTIAVRESHRRLGIGERLLIAAIETAVAERQETITLEVRASNEAAQRLYEKYRFQRVGLRKRYYTDNNEDALLLTAPDILSPEYAAFFASLCDQHRAAHPDLWP
ncbi:MAG TPA: ribosomal protein S18-alanine N-acetyltransferase [Dehalococcoidia bacterium]|nr:ribosomal protein S18-alanine N-acetyltransferase [Dehalococcoidia bacterium]